MVSSKGKPTKVSAIQALEDPRASKNLKGFKIYSGSERPHEWCGDPSRKNVGSGHTMMPRKSGPIYASQIGLSSGKGKIQGTENKMGKCENSVKVRTERKALADVSNVNNARTYQLRANKMGKCENSVKVRTERKALADVSNVNNARTYQLRARPSGNPKPMKNKLEGCTTKQGKSNIVKSPYVPRISLTKSVVVANVSAKKLIGGKVQGIGSNRKFDTSVKVTTGRKTLAVVSNVYNVTSCQLGNRLSNNPKLLKDKLEGSKLPQMHAIKSNGIRNTSGLRISLTRSAAVTNASSKKLIGTTGTTLQPKSKVKRTSLITKKSATIDTSENKEVNVPTRSSCDDNASVIHQGCSLEKVQGDGSCCSDEVVTTVISRPKRNRRKSYTLSLMARSEIMGECVDFVRKDELPNIDDSTNPLEVVEYVDDIYQYYWTMEVLNPSLANYMAIQSEITPRMRGVLVNWLIEVHLKLDLMQETLFLMVELLDRVLSIASVKKNDLQMVGLTALLLASKYEDFWHPKINELISISADSYTREQMLAMEKLILTRLRYRLNVPTPYVFMLRFLKAGQSDQKLEHLAFYLVELCLVEYEALSFKPSLLCASAIYVARCTFHMTPAWTGLLRRHARYEESQLRACADMILRFQRTAGRKPASTTYDKFLNPDRSRVAAIEALDKLPPLSVDV